MWTRYHCKSPLPQRSTLRPSSPAPVLLHPLLFFFSGMSHIGQAGNYTELSWEPAVKQTRYLFKQTERGGESRWEDRNRRAERCSKALKEKTARWVKISPPFSEQRPIQLKLDQSTQMCLVSGYQIQQGQGVGQGGKTRESPTIQYSPML